MSRPIVQLRVSMDAGAEPPAVDVRAWAPFTAAAVPMPTKQALTIPLALLPQLIADLQAAEATARDEGLIRGD